MKKKMLGVIVLLLFSGITMGYTIGQVITQTQFDNQDFTTANLGYSLDDKTRTSKYIQLDVGYTTLEKELDVNDMQTGNWVVTRKTKDVRYYLEDYVNCREDANKSVCVTQAKQEIKNELIAFRKLVRKDLTQQQTNYGNEITKNDFNSSIILV